MQVFIDRNTILFFKETMESVNRNSLYLLQVKQKISLCYQRIENTNQHAMYIPMQNGHIY